MRPVANLGKFNVDCSNLHPGANFMITIPKFEKDQAEHETSCAKWFHTKGNRLLCFLVPKSVRY